MTRHDTTRHDMTRHDMTRYDMSSILFADIVGFTAISSHCQAAELVSILNELFARFDKLADKYHQMRIKILGDCYYAISGAPEKRPDHAVLCVHMGLSMVEAIRSVREKTKSTVDMRVGVHTGAVLAGVLGQRQWQFDVYSKDVELANKMESSGLPGRVHISNATLKFLNNEFEVSEADGESREESLRLAHIKTYFIERVLKPYPEGTLDAVAGGGRDSSSSSAAAAGHNHNRNDSCDLDKQINQFSLNFVNETLERQFRSTSDIASCISLIGLPITLLCAFLAHTFLYQMNPQVTITYATCIMILSLLVLICIIPYMLNQPKNAGKNGQTKPANQTTIPLIETTTNNDKNIINNNNNIDEQAELDNINTTTTYYSNNIIAIHDENNCSNNSNNNNHTTFNAAYSQLMSLADSIRHSAWMKLVLTGLMTFIWMYAHIIACQKTSRYLNDLTKSLIVKLFTSHIFNYFTIVCSLAITAITRISYLVKTIIIISVISIQIFMNLMLDSHHYDQYIFTLTLATICWALILINRQFELTNRRLFLWRKQVEERKEKVADMREKNEALVYNILPPNVAKIFLGRQILNDEELYSKSYEAVGVLFAAMPNFSNFYTEESVNNQGLECLRFLNEVISDYDALLGQERFKNIIKIKTMGSTYMAASGLYEGDAAEAKARLSSASGASSHSQQELVDPIKVKWGHLEQLTDFALALKETLNNINRESFNNFVLRIGINHGPITAGVIGAKKPHFDMWGNTVNVASRMESTGRAGSIQVVEETSNILRQFGFKLEERGIVSVKGKGELMTFYLIGRG